VQSDRQWFAIRFEQATPLEALLQLAKQTRRHLRQAQDSIGRPLRQLEFGAFGARAPIRLLAPTGDLNAMVANPRVRVISAITYRRLSKSVINTLTPLGAGTGDTQVNLERAWRIVNDPLYVNYGKWGPAVGSVFPEYDQFRWPIKRRAKRDGSGWEYYVRDTVAYLAVGKLAGLATGVGMEVRGKYSDPQFAYTDSTVADQELTARALYVATTAKLTWESAIQETLQIDTVGAFRPPIAGSRVPVDFRRISTDVRGNFSEMDTAAQATLAAPYILKVERAYETSGKRTDTWTLSNTLVQPFGGATASAQPLRDLEAIKIMPTNQTAFLGFGTRRLRG
jgi:hypothetical protein